MKKFAYLTGAVVLYLAIQVCPANALTVNLNPANINLACVDGTFKINVMVANVTNLGGFQFALSYPPEIVTVNDTSDVLLGPFLGSTGRTTGTLGPNIDNVGGTVHSHHRHQIQQ